MSGPRSVASLSQRVSGSSAEPGELTIDLAFSMLPAASDAATAMATVRPRRSLRRACPAAALPRPGARSHPAARSPARRAARPAPQPRISVPTGTLPAPRAARSRRTPPPAAAPTAPPTCPDELVSNALLDVVDELARSDLGHAYPGLRTLAVIGSPGISGYATRAADSIAAAAARAGAPWCGRATGTGHAGSLRGPGRCLRGDADPPVRVRLRRWRPCPRCGGGA